MTSFLGQTKKYMVPLHEGGGIWMIESFRKFKALYPPARFPDVYFVMGAFTSGGTATQKGLLIGLDQTVRTPDIPQDELTIWQKNNSMILQAFQTWWLTS